MTASHHKSSFFTSLNPSNIIKYPFFHLKKIILKNLNHKNMLENLNKTPRNFYGGTHRNFQVKRISKLHFPRSTLQTLNSGLSRFETRLGLILKNRKSENQAFSACRGQKNTKIKRFEKFAYNAGAFFLKRFYYDPKSKTIKPLTQA